MTALAHRGPGFKQHVLEQLRRINRSIDLAWCNFRKHWIVVIKSGPMQRSWWNGRWHTGFDIIVRWAGIGGVYRAAFPHEKCGFLPLDNRLVRLVRACDLSRRASVSERFNEMEAADIRRDAWRAQQKADVKQESEGYFRGRHVLHRASSVPGFNPGQVNDYETEEEVQQEMSARMRRAMNRVRQGLPPNSRID